MSDREINRLRGPVASVRTEHFGCDPQTGEVSARPRFANIVAYDLEGRTTSTTYENPDGSTGTTRSTYNGRGDLAQTSSEWAGRFGDDTVYHYDDAGRLLRVTGHKPDGSERESLRYSYEPDGSKTEVRFGFSAAEIEEDIKEARNRAANTGMEFGVDLPPATTTIRYDPEGKPLEELQHDDSHILLKRTVYTYNDRGLLTEKRWEAGHKSLFSSQIEDPRLDPLEREALQKMFDRLFQPGASFERVTYTYDDQGRKIEEVIEHAPFNFTKTKFEYDQYGNETVARAVHESREFRLQADGELGDPAEPKRTESTSFHQYAYDAHGNWTERRSMFLDSATQQAKCHTIERRAIEYW